MHNLLSKTIQKRKGKKKKGNERFGKKPEKKNVRRKEKIENTPCEE
jgi:hypothetical protein